MKYHKAPCAVFLLMNSWLFNEKSVHFIGSSFNDTVTKTNQMTEDLGSVQGRSLILSAVHSVQTPGPSYSPSQLEQRCLSLGMKRVECEADI
jgi:hypothetical protein